MGSIYSHSEKLSFLNAPENAKAYKYFKIIHIIALIGLLLFTMALFLLKIIEARHILVTLLIGALIENITITLIGFYHGIITVTVSKKKLIENTDGKMRYVLLLSISFGCVVFAVLYALYLPANIMLLPAVILVHYLLCNITFTIGMNRKK